MLESQTRYHIKCIRVQQLKKEDLFVHVINPEEFNLLPRFKSIPRDYCSQSQFSMARLGSSNEIPNSPHKAAFMKKSRSLEPFELSQHSLDFFSASHQ